MIPVFEPVIGEDEIAAVAAAVRRGEISGSFGRSIPEFESGFATYCGVKHGIAVTSGTTALQLAVRAAGIGAGDEVLVSACTNIATALAVSHNNAIPVPVDSENLTWNLDLDQIEKSITPATKAIIPVHVYGHPVYMPKLMKIAKKHNLIVIEDCAEAHGALCDGKKAGSFGEMSCFSFYANKIITTGEGGMIVTDNDAYAEKMRLLRNLAFTTPRFRYEEAGYNYRMTGYQAAMGLVQLEKIEKIIDDKRRVAKLYNKHLSGIPGLKLPAEETWAKNVYWMYAVVLIDSHSAGRDALLTKLTAKGIETRTFFCPMNRQPCLTKLSGYRQVSCPVAEKLWETGFYLPSAHNLTEEEVIYIAEAIENALKG